MLVLVLVLVREMEMGGRTSEVSEGVSTDLRREWQRRWGGSCRGLPPCWPWWRPCPSSCSGLRYATCMTLSTIEINTGNTYQREGRANDLKGFVCVCVCGAGMGVYRRP